MKKASLNQSPIVNDLLTLSGNLVGNILGARHELKAQAKQRFETIAHQIGVPGRDEIEMLTAMVTKTRMKQEEILERLSAVEAKLKMSSKSGPATKRKPRLQSLRKSNDRNKRN